MLPEELFLCSGVPTLNYSLSLVFFYNKAKRARLRSGALAALTLMALFTLFPPYKCTSQSSYLPTESHYLFEKSQDEATVTVGCVPSTNP